MANSIRSVVDQVSSLRDELGDPGPSLREIWKSIDNLPKRGDIDWLYRNEQNTQDEWRWITSPPPPLELDEESIRFLSDKMAPFRNREETIGVMRNLQRGGLLPSGEYLSWSGGDWSMDGKAIEVPFVLLRDMIKSNGGRKDIDWGALLRTIDLAVTKVLEMRNPDRPTKRAQTLSPAYYLLTRRNVHLSSFSSFDSEFGRKRISSFPSDFGDASWLRTWDHGGSDRPGMLHHHIDPDEAMQHVSLSIKNGKLLFKVRRPGGVFRNIRIPPNPDLVAKIVSWSLSRHTSAEFRRIDCIRTMIFAGRDSKLVEGPERTALKPNEERLRLNRRVHNRASGQVFQGQGNFWPVLRGDILPKGPRPPWLKIPNRSMTETLVPSVPPVSPFEAYTIIIVLPFLMRLIFVAPPLVDLSNKLLPKEDRGKHARWALDRIKRLNVERFWLIILNEMLAIFLPAVIAISARVYMGPIGWESWEIPFLGLTLLALAGLLWIGYDFTRVTRTRRDVLRLAQFDINKARQAVDTAVTGRDLLKSLRGITIPRPWKSDDDSQQERSAFSPFGLATSVLEAGADILDMALDEVRIPAGEAVDKMDSEIQRRIQQRVQASKRSMVIGTLFAAFPLVVLLGLPKLL